MVGVTDKDVTLTARVSQTTKQQLPEHINTSGLVRDLVTNYVRAGDTQRVSLERRVKDLEQEVSNLEIKKQEVENDLQRKQRELELAQKKLTQRVKHTPEQVVEFAERINSGGFTTEQLEPDNPAIQTWARKAGLEPERFITEVRDRL